MGERAEGLAKKFESKAGELSSVLEKLSDADWKKVTSAEKWPVGVTAHHVAGAHEPIVGMVKTVASGQALPPFTMAQLDEMNAKHAKDFAGCTKAETLASTRRARPTRPRPCAGSRTPSWTRAAPCSPACHPCPCTR